MGVTIQHTALSNESLLIHYAQVLSNIQPTGADEIDNITYMIKIKFPCHLLAVYILKIKVHYKY